MIKEISNARKAIKQAKDSMGANETTPALALAQLALLAKIVTQLQEVANRLEALGKAPKPEKKPAKKRISKKK